MNKTDAPQITNEQRIDILCEWIEKNLGDRIRDQRRASSTQLTGTLDVVERSAGRKLFDIPGMRQ